MKRLEQLQWFQEQQALLVEREELRRFFQRRWSVCCTRTPPEEFPSDETNHDLSFRIWRSEHSSWYAAMDDFHRRLGISHHEEWFTQVVSVFGWHVLHHIQFGPYAYPHLWINIHPNNIRVKTFAPTKYESSWIYYEIHRIFALMGLINHSSPWESGAVGRWLP